MNTIGNITLTSDVYQVSSAFLPTPLTVGPKDSFAVYFSYQATPLKNGSSAPADGLAFVVQNLGPTSASYIGMSGSGLGFFTGTSIPAVGVAFDYYTNAITGTPAGTVAISLPEGVAITQTTPTLPVFPGANSYRSVWIYYYNSTKEMDVYFSDGMTRPATPILTTVLPVDLSSLMGGQVYVGVTAGTGQLGCSQTLVYFAASTKAN